MPEVAWHLRELWRPLTQKLAIKSKRTHRWKRSKTNTFHFCKNNFLDQEVVLQYLIDHPNHNLGVAILQEMVQEEEAVVVEVMETTVVREMEIRS